jgi:hypothetical protein
MGVGSGIQKKTFTDPGSRVKKASYPGTGYATMTYTVTVPNFSITIPMRIHNYQKVQ